MYGRKKYGLPKKVEQPVVNNVAPTFVCSRCKLIKPLNSKYSDINLTTEAHVKMLYRICEYCFNILDTWMKVK